MKLKRENRNARQGVHRNGVRMNAARLNRIVLVVALLWLVTSALVLFFYRPGDASAVQPGDSRQQLALHMPPADDFAVISNRTQ